MNSASAEPGGAPTPIQAIDHTWSPEEPPKVQLIKRLVPGQSSAEIEVYFPDFIGVFPLEELRYIEGEQRVKVESWDDLPSGSRDVYSYKPHPVNHYIWELSLTLVPSGETVSYRIRVEANYDTGRDILVEEVNKRRRN